MKLAVEGDSEALCYISESDICIKKYWSIRARVVFYVGVPLPLIVSLLFVRSVKDKTCQSKLQDWFTDL